MTIERVTTIMVKKQVPPISGMTRAVEVMISVDEYQENCEGKGGRILNTGFIKNVIERLGSENALYRFGERKVTLPQMIPAFEAECQKVAASNQELSLLHSSQLRSFSVTLGRIAPCPWPISWVDTRAARLRRLGFCPVLENRFDPFTSDLQPPSACGCTHKPFLKNVPQVDMLNIKPGVRIHYVDMGARTPACSPCAMASPENWFSWRYQIPALADAGFRVLALDMKGYGDSTAPADIEEYSQEQIMLDLVTFLNKWCPQSIHTAMFGNRTESWRPQAVEDLFFTKVCSTIFDTSFPSTAGVCQRGGLFVGSPEDPPRSAILSESALQYYVQQFTKSGFRGPLNWYRNGEKNWLWMCSRPRGKIMMPAFMVTAGKDPVLLPAFAAGMENLVPNLTRGHIEECGHWTQIERPTELNKILISWLKATHQKASIPVHPKL
ncbi:bifunctional epoxide hydrolase 2-like [Cyprinus carpio]|uniref:Bifunctional epoxide hydrolase 2-like n=1 Tax=Cyprinus carpio TaxID=7962 RepID=A0A9Q9Y0R0_CYPCA|nr:bifunctional epoxide hydrolase 2-like [Cyprinus carpio]